MNPLRRLDDRILFAVNDWARQTPGLHPLLLGYAKFGVVLFAVLLLAALYAVRRRPSPVLAAAGWAPAAMLLALALNQPLGHLVQEPRPYAVHPGLLRLADVTTDFSFPSDHAVMAGAVAAGLLMVHRRLGAAAVLAALVMAFARVYIAAHFPWDVVVGLAFGAAVAVVGWLLFRAPLVRLAEWLRSRPGLSRAFPEDRSLDPVRP